MRKDRFAWQKAAIAAITASERKSALLVATPASGKTRVASQICRNMIDEGGVEFVIVASPSINIARGFQREMHMLGIEIIVNNSNDDLRLGIPKGIQGVAMCYQSIFSNPDIYRGMCSRFKAFVILDEVHHLAENKEWGREIRRAFDGAEFRLLLSGTPFRSDNDAIPYVRYVDGSGQADFDYGYDDALRDGCVRDVWFPAVGGEATWQHDGEITRATFKDDLPEEEMNRRLRTAIYTLDDRDGVMEHLIVRAYQKLQELRQEDKDAGMLIICNDQLHATNVSNKLGQWVREKAVLAISDNADAHDQIEQFKSSGDPILVAVHMVSEGVDIPRLRVVVLATTITTELHFRQAVGRCLRVEKEPEDQSAYVYLVADQRLVEFAEKIKEQRSAVLQEQLEQEIKDRLGDGERNSTFHPMSSRGEGAGFIYDTQRYGSEELALAEQEIIRFPGLGNPEAVAAIIRKYSSGSRLSLSESSIPTSECREERCRKLRKEGTNITRSAAFKWKMDFKEVERTINEKIGVIRVTMADPEQLEERIRIADRLYKTGRYE